MECMITECKNKPEYNYEYYSNPAYCRKHKNEQMVRKNENICVIL